jgi:chemotaxis protein methyltransferase CheR
MSATPEIYKFFSDYIYEKTGITYTEKDYYRLDSRFKDLIEYFELENVNALYQMYKTNITPDMHAVLINFSTNNETYFFRDKRPFKVLAKEVLPKLEEQYKMGLLNIWSAAASTGQEALSIAISVKERAGEKMFDRILIDGTDISKEALEKAEKGIYNGLDVQRGMPITTLMKYFEQLENEDWKANREIKTKVRYSEFNLLTDVYRKNYYHVIFCRNVLIYQDKQNKENILNELYTSLKPGGYMFLGNGESLIGLTTGFERETYDGLTVYRKPLE